MFKPEVHLYTEQLSTGKTRVEHLTAKHEPFCGCMNHKYLGAEIVIEEKDKGQQSFTYSYVINDMLEVSGGSKGSLGFHAILGKMRANYKSKSKSESESNCYATNNIVLDKDRIAVNYYDQCYRHGGTHLYFSNDVNGVRMFSSGVGSYIITSAKMSKLYELMPVVDELKKEISSIEIKKKTPQMIYEEIGKIVKQKKYEALVLHIDELLQYNQMELASDGTVEGKKEVQKMLNVLHHNAYRNLPDDITDDNYKWIEDTYAVYRSSKPELVNVHRIMACRVEDVKCFKQIEENDDKGHQEKQSKLRGLIAETFKSQALVNKLDHNWLHEYKSLVKEGKTLNDVEIDAVIKELESEERFNYIVTLPDGIRVSKSLKKVRNLVRKYMFHGYGVVGSDLSYPSVTCPMDKLEMAYIVGDQ